MPPPSVPFELLPSDAAPTSCKPILMIGLPSSGDWAKYMSHVLIHNLLYASNSSYMGGSDDYEDKLKHLQSLDGDGLLALSTKHVSATILSENDILDQRTLQVDMNKIRRLEKEVYQAVIVDDTCFIREPDVTAFVMKQYNSGASVVIMAIEGIYDLSSLNARFNVNWRFAGYTTRMIELNSLGKQVIGNAFPLDYHYVKAHFVVGGGELFTEYLCPEDYEDEEDYPDGPPPPSPGAPVITSLGETKSVSYFGFSNPLDVSYGAIILQLCFAKSSSLLPKQSDSGEKSKQAIVEGDRHQKPVNKGEKKVLVPRKKLQSVPELLSKGDEDSSPAESLKSKILWMTFLLLLFYISFDLFLQKHEVKEDMFGEESEL